MGVSFGAELAVGLALEVPAGDEHRAGDRALVVLVLLAHVEEGRLAEARLGVGGLDLVDPLLHLGEQLAVTGHCMSLLTVIRACSGMSRSIRDGKCYLRGQVFPSEVIGPPPRPLPARRVPTPRSGAAPRPGAPRWWRSCSGSNASRGRDDVMRCRRWATELGSAYRNGSSRSAMPLRCSAQRARSRGVDDVERDRRRCRHRPVDVDDGGGGLVGAQQLAVEQELDAHVRARERAAARHARGGEVVEQVVLEIEEPTLAMEDRVGVVVELHAGARAATPRVRSSSRAIEAQARHRREVGERGAEQELGVGARAVDGDADRDVPDEVHDAARVGSRRDDGGQRDAELLAHDRVGRVVERRRLRVEDREPRAVAQRDLGERGGGIHAERRADREEHVGAAGALLRAHEVGFDEALAERDRARLQHAAAHEARRVVLAGAHAVEGLLHRAAPPAVEALRLVRGAVDLDRRSRATSPRAGAGRRRSGSRACAARCATRGRRARGDRRSARRPTSGARRGRATPCFRSSGSAT